MFEDALIESANRGRTKSRWSLLALAINCAALIAIVIWPLLHPQALPVQMVATLLVAPPDPPPLPPQATPVRVQVHSQVLDNELLAPSRIPTTIKMLHEAAAQPPTSGVPDMQGIADTNPGDALNGIVRGLGAAHPSIVRVAPPSKVCISSGVMAGNLLDKVPPQYPAIAREARIAGTVVLQATISKAGTIQNLRVINGPALLQQAALDAVRSWRYKPYLLNGQPVEVETTINVVFNLGS
jgi:periplasmic protein TonB